MVLPLRGVAHNPWRLPLILLLAGAAWPWMTLTACPSVCSDILGRDGGCVPVIESFQSRALAVGQCTIRAKYSVLRLVAKRDGRGFGDMSEESVAVAVGQDKDPLPLVRRAAFTR